MGHSIHVESVWDYPRPPRVEPVSKRVQVILGGETVADTTRAHRVLETSHPPVYYLPLADVESTALVRVEGSSFCEWKGQAHYYDVVQGDRRAERSAWGYAKPTAPFERLVDHVAFYAGPMDECTVDGERAQPQPGGFYGGWITKDLVGPFKGGPGSRGW